jgi:glycosyltransferase involved in cell wall biosynthesis
MAGPEISVVIPAFERIGALEGCLHALAAQTLPPSKFEVIVCDDGSRLPVRDALASTLGALADRLHVRVIRQDNGGPAAARNRGAGAAIGRYLAFTDDDCRHATQAIVAHDHALTLGAYWLQHFTYGRGLLQVRRRLRRTGVSMRSGSLPGSFHLRLIVSPVARAGPRGAACAVLVGLAQAATAAGVLAELAVPTFRPKARQAAELF